jgi:hypothetical protein
LPSLVFQKLNISSCSYRLLLRIDFMFPVRTTYTNNTTSTRNVRKQYKSARKYQTAEYGTFRRDLGCGISGAFISINSGTTHLLIKTWNDFVAKTRTTPSSFVHRTLSWNTVAWGTLGDETASICQRFNKFEFER